ncbi:DUF2851 family protein [Bacteroidales bacterium OttesenSCG-928-A17]|nr:DUF2851 family protein [Bacteroidales bacterium OttesenSCG-928-A17]
MESLLHYVWKYRLFDSENLKTIEGIPFEIIDPGIHNTHAGPDFFNAKIRMNDKLWAGNIEIHINSSDWYKHQHERNKMYNSVILHVVECLDELEIRDESGRNIPQWIMKMPGEIRKNYVYLLNNDSSIPCLGQIHSIPEIYMRDWMNALLLERLERKTRDLSELIEKSQSDWAEVFYILLARNFGFGINNDAFERLAKSLPLKIILKHRDSELQTEALFLGQAGLLEENNPDDYYRRMQKEYHFLKKKYNLQSLESHLFKNLRIRPNNFPHIKIIQLASIIRREQGLFSRFIEENNQRKLYSFFDTEIGDYWKCHTHFGKNSRKMSRKLGASTINILLINSLVPILFIYGKQKELDVYTERAFLLLETLPPEKNFITNLFERAGIKIKNAADSQALIQLKREYCEKKKCMFCRIGHKLLSKQKE